jgi:hypothetical protein
VPRWFLLINGIALLTMGLVLLPMRLRERPLYRHFFGIVWAILCCLVGAALIAMAQGYLDVPGQKPGSGRASPTAGPGGPPRLEFPSGR